jgi:hypothetical protein
MYHASMIRRGGIVALQGDLASFALSDVLRLLASTEKSGRLVVSGDLEHGEVWLRDGALTGGRASTRPSATGAADVLFEIQQFPNGSFVFEAADDVEGSDEPLTIDEALKTAAGLQAEWDDVVKVVPSLDHWITMTPELAGQSIVVNADQWKLLASLGNGATVRTLGERFADSDLAASKRVKAMAEAKLVEVGEPKALPQDTWNEYRSDDVAPIAAAAVAEVPAVDEIAADLPAAAPAPAFDHGFLDVASPRTLEPLPGSVEDDLVRLGGDPAPLVLETRDDALLPEPLPGEGTAFSIEAEPVLGAAEAAFQGPEALPVFVDDDEEPALGRAFAPVERPVSRDLEAVDHPDPFDVGALEVHPQGVDHATIWDGEELGTSEDAFARVGWDALNPPVDHLNGGHFDDGSDRSSLKFLSNVKS